MALNISKETGFGVNATYWHITKIYINYHVGILTAIMEGHLDEDARRSGKAKLKDVAFEFTGSDFDYGFDDNITSKTYDKIKLMKEWSLSKDV